MSYDKKIYKIWNWKSITILHWIINPGIVILELFLGQVVPKVMLIKRDGNQPFYQRSFIPCPHCGTLHPGVTYSAQNKTALKNWFGLYCYKCDKVIPVQRNLTSLIILALTFPIWGWFRKSLKNKWLKKQPERYQNLNLEQNQDMNSKQHWFISGLVFGTIMFLLMEIITPLIKGLEITTSRILISIPIWFLGGLLWGYVMHKWMNKKGRSE